MSLIQVPRTRSWRPKWRSPLLSNANAVRGVFDFRSAASAEVDLVKQQRLQRYGTVKRGGFAPNVSGVEFGTNSDLGSNCGLVSFSGNGNPAADYTVLLAVVAKDTTSSGGVWCRAPTAADVRAGSNFASHSIRQMGGNYTWSGSAQVTPVVPNKLRIIGHRYNDSNGRLGVIVDNNEVSTATSIWLTAPTASIAYRLFGNGYPGSTNHIIVAALELQRSITDAEVANIPELFWDVFDAGRLTVPVVSPAGYAHPTLSAVTGLNVTASSFRPSVTYTF